MKFICSVCDNGTGSDGNPCGVCGGDGEIDLLDSDFDKIVARRRVRGMIWSAILTRLSDIEDKVDDVITKCNDIFEKLNE